MLQLSSSLATNGMSRPASDYMLNAYQSVIAVICMQNILSQYLVCHSLETLVIPSTEVTHLADKSVVC